MSCTQTVALGAYLLGSLDPAERSSFERHVHTCPTCRREMVRLAPLPGLLGQVQLADLELPFDDPVPEPDLWPLPPEPEPEPAPPPRDRRRRAPGRRLVLVGAAVVIALVVVAGFLVPGLVGDDGATATWHATDNASGVVASADLVRKSWGTELWMSMENMPKGARCKLIVHDRDGRTEIGGWWGTDHAADERIPGSTSFAVEEIERLDVVVDMNVLVSVRP